MRITLELNLSTSGNGIICVAILAIIVVVGIVVSSARECLGYFILRLQPL
jgi:hypothetical protein